MAKSLLALAGIAAASAQAPPTNWTVIGTYQAIAVAVDQVDGKTGYIGAGINGEGYQLWKTTDNWNTYDTTIFPDALILTDVTSYSTNVQVVGTLDFYYSNDSGATFKNSSMQYPGASESVGNIGPVEQEIGFGIVGAFAQTLFAQDEGVATSFNAGANYSVSNITALDTAARYGAFPTDTTWFVTAGQFPGEGSDDSGKTTTSGGSSTGVAAAGEYIVDRSHYINVHQIPEGSTFLKAYGARAHVVRTPKGDNVFAVVKKEHTFNANLNRFQLGNGPNITTYWDQVVKTTDGGKTWSTVYNVFNKNYGNQLHCTSATHCCFPAEAPGNIGAEIVCTFDGTNFATTYTNPDPFSSIVGMGALSENVWYAGGAELTSLGPQNAQFYMSTDGGHTWSKIGQQYSQDYIVDMDCVPSANSCWAVSLNVATQSFSMLTLSN